MTEATKPNQDETDWKSIATALAKRVNFAITNCDCRGGLMDLNTGKASGWLDYMAEAMDMIPGVTVDREILATMYLPRTRRKKAQAEILKRRAALDKASA